MTERPLPDRYRYALMSVAATLMLSNSPEAVEAALFHGVGNAWLEWARETVEGPRSPHRWGAVTSD